MKKKILILIISIVIINIFLSTGSFVRNNLLLNKYANQLYAIPLPQGTLCVASNKAVGNLYGTGNHLDFVATIEIQSTLSEDVLIEYYNEQSKKIKSVGEISVIGLKTYADTPIKHTTQHIEVIPKSLAHYVIGSTKIYERISPLDDSIDTNTYIVQIKDTHYGANWDLRTH